MKNCPKCKLIKPDIAERATVAMIFPVAQCKLLTLTANDRRRKGDAIGGALAFFLLMRYIGFTSRFEYRHNSGPRADFR